MIPLGVMASGHVEAKPVFQTSLIDTATATTHTFTSVPIGAASSTRRVVVATSAKFGGHITSVTIGGVSATCHVYSTDIPNQGAEIWSAVVPTGSTATIVVTYPSASNGCGIGVWSLPNQSPTGHTAWTRTNPNPSVTLTTTAGEFVVACDSMSMTTGSQSATWTGATKRCDAIIQASDNAYSGADVTAAGTSTTITATSAITSANTLVACGFA